MARAVQPEVFYSLEGARELNAGLRQFSVATQRYIAKSALKDAAEPMRIAAGQYAPDDPRTPAPDLHRSIAISNKLVDSRGLAEFHAQMARDGDKELAVLRIRQARRTQRGRGAAVAFLGPKRQIYYAGMQEFGTVRHAANPYLSLAWTRHRHQTLDRLKVALTRRIASTAARAAARAAKKRAPKTRRRR